MMPVQPEAQANQAVELSSVMEPVQERCVRRIRDGVYERAPAHLDSRNTL